MGWFSPVKGSYPSLAQVDKTLPLSGDVSTIERGMIVALGAGTGDDEANGVWKRPNGTTDKLLYVALSDATDPTAGFAGTSFTPNPTDAHPARPAITALDLAQDGEFETSVFDTTATYTVGMALSADSNGKIVPQSGGAYILGYVTAIPKERWINNAVAAPSADTDRRLAYRTGAALKVLRFKTAV